MSSYTAQNIGAGKDERVEEGYKASLLMVLIRFKRNLVVHTDWMGHRSDIFICANQKREMEEQEAA
ncbi:hypothetical protein [Extibacter muris]|uniref:hypothetical protein n=1 Tax=Extibacter muris TaxID=1796622 RepID=UPI0011AEA410|nr:hypothetical protein [Extibacter muris]